MQRERKREEREERRREERRVNYSKNIESVNLKSLTICPPPPHPSPPLPPPLLIRILALINFCQLFFFQPLTSSIRIWESVHNSFKTFSLFKQNLTFIHFKFSRKHHIIIIIKCISFCSRSFFDALWSKKMGDEIKKKINFKLKKFTRDNILYNFYI